MLLNRKLRIVLTLAFAMATVTGLWAQDEKTTMRAMYTMYAGLNSLQMNVSMQLYTKAADVKPMQESTGKVCKEGINYYSEMMGRKTVINKNACVLVDNINKVIVYSEPDVKTRNEKNKMHEVLPDSVLFGQGVLRTISNANGEHCIEIKYANDPQYDRIEMTINTTDHTLRKIVYFLKPYLGKAPVFEKMVVTYSAIQLNTDIPGSIFSIDGIITVSRNQAVAQGQYGGYQVIDQRVYNKQAQ
jgi:hypothetical protein